MPGSHRVAVFAPKKVIPSRYSNFSLSGVELEVNEEKAEYAINLR